MLADWYFCCCISSPPDKTAAFLSIIETLANPESESALLQIALAELERTDSWMRWYAVPHVLDATHHTEADDSFRAAAGHLLRELIQELPGEVDAYSLVVGLCLDRDSSSNLLAGLASLAGEPRREGLMPSDQPYLDLHEFAPQNLLLSIMADCLWEDSGANTHLRSYLGSRRSDGALNSLLDEALEGRLGRLALRLAARITRRVFTEIDTGLDLAKRLRSVPNAALAFEPDLLHSLAESLYWTLSAADLLEETVALAQMPRAPEHAHPLGTMGIDGVPDDHRQALAIGLWQATLWELAAQLRPEDFATSIRSAWRMREGGHIRPDQPLYISPLRSDHGNWLAALQDFWEEIKLAEDQALPLQASRPPHRPPSALVLQPLSSPLLPIPPATLTKASSLNGLIRYPTADRPLVQLRLWSGALTAVRLLQRIPQDHPERSVLAQVIAQTADALQLLYGDSKHGWFANYDKPDARVWYRLPTPLTGLALFVNRQMNLAARGELRSIEPNLFVSLLDANWLNKTFRRFALPPRMMGWIGGAYPGGTPGAPTARWLELIPDVNASFEYEYYRDWHWDDQDPVSEDAALVVRFLCPEALDRAAIAHLDWRYAVAKKKRSSDSDRPAEWLVPLRRMLLTDALGPEDWLRPSWKQQNLYPMPKMVRALERLASLRRTARPDESLRTTWIAEFMEGLNGLVQHKSLDRFVRLRLIEFIDDPALAPDAEAQELIALTVLEHGRSYELHALLQRLYLNTNEPGSGRRAVQERLIPAILQSAADNLTKQGARLNPRDPRQTLYERAEAELIEDFLIRMAHRGAIMGRGEWLKRLRDWREAGRCERADTRLRRREVDVEIVDGQKRLRLATGSLPALAVRAICYNPNQFSGSVYHDDLELPPDAVDLFGKPEHEVRAFLSGRWTEPPYVLSFVVRAAIEPDNRFPYQYWFDIGARHTTKFGRVDNVLQVGDRVLLPLAPAGHDTHGVRVDGRYPIRSARCWREGDIARVTLSRMGAGGPLAARTEDGDEIDLSSWQARDLWDIWDPDLTLSHPLDQADTSWSWAVLAERIANRRWRPLDRDLPDWLAEWPAQGTATLAAYVGPEARADGRIRWRFSTQPGRNFLLGPDHLLKADAEELAEVLDNCRAGLLVAFELNPDSDTDKPRVLRLARDALSLAALANRYPDLQVPFDRRNPEWAKLYDDGTDLVAHRDLTKRWWIDLRERPISGFPTSIEVKWRGSSPSIRQGRAELSDVRATPRASYISARWVHVYEVQPEADWEDFCARWLAPAIHMSVRLERYQGIQKSGLIGCLTDEYVYVSVAPESISMHHWNSDLFTPGRQAEIYQVQDGRLSESGGLLDAKDLEQLDILHGRNELRGIVTSVPRPDEGSDLCAILWEAEPSNPVSLHIANAADASLRPGMIVVATHRPEGWSLEQRWRTVQVRALWEIREQVSADGAGNFLGIVYWRSGRRALFELAPGQLALLPERTRGGGHLVERERGNDSAGAVFGSWSEVRRRGNSSRGAVIQSGGDLYGLMQGRSNDDSPLARVVDVRMEIGQSATLGGYYWLTRTFVLRPTTARPSVADRRPAVSSADSANQHWQQRWQEYLANPGPLPVTSDGCTVTLLRLRAPTDSAKTDWTAQVSVAPDESAYIDNVEYSKDALARLYLDAEGRVFASFRQVDDFTPERFYSEKMVGRLGQETQRLAAPLYYVGTEQARSEDPGVGRSHRFEWGRGFTLLVPEEQLRFDGRDFSQVRFALFYGDMITELKVSIGEPLATPVGHGTGDENEDVSERSSRLIFDIQQHSLEFSQGRSLYNQSMQSVVHVLSLEGCGDSIRVSSVQGFNSGSDTNEWSLGSDIMSFKPKAELGAESRARLKGRWPVGTGHKLPLIILGRLNVKEFEVSLGKRVIYDHVRLTFLPNPEEATLRDQDLVFMRSSGLIEPENRNDIYLNLVSYAKLHRDDIGEDFSTPVRLKRREFSVREDLLYRIADDLRAKGSHNLAFELVLLVRLRRNDARVAATLQHGLTRRERALKRALQASGGVVFGGVLSEPRDGELLIEMAPGFFVRVSYRGAATFHRGDLVTLEVDGSGYLVTPLVPSHARYLASGPRPAVALPMDSLFDRSLGAVYPLDDDRTWLQRKLIFSLGGLAGVVAQPGTYDSDGDQWSDPDAKDFIALMSRPPPQLVTAGIDRTGRPRLGVESLRGWISGRLEEGDGGKVVGRALDGPKFASETRDLDWLSLTFRDTPVAEVVTRARRDEWRYHDRFSGYWTGKDGTGGISRQPTRPMTVFDGPVFFQGNGWRLRYPPGYFERIGYPVRELIERLRVHRDKDCSFPVAGPSDTSGLWIEVAPGRLAELPGAMVFFCAGGQQRSLARFHWQAVAPGDTVELCLAENNTYAPDRVCLVSWRAGPRKALGTARSLLPVLDAQQGALVLGAAEVRLTLPVARPDPNWQAAILGADNSLTEGKDAILDRGDVVLLGLGQNGDIRCLGAPRLTPFADPQDNLWVADPLAKECREASRLANLIQAAGGALPVTLERIDRPGGRFTFSRRAQHWPAGDRRGPAIGQVVGVLDQDRVLLRVGGVLLPVAVDVLVAGLPAGLPTRRAIGRALFEARLDAQPDFGVWLDVESNGTVIGSGLPENGAQSRPEFAVVPLAAIEGSLGNGLLCRALFSRKLYWLSARELAWARLSAEQLREHVAQRPGVSLWVRRQAHVRASETISVLATGRAERELDRLRVGREMLVRAIVMLGDRIDGCATYLVESFASKVMLTCETQSELVLDSEVSVEVVRRSSGVQQQVVVAPKGEQPRLLDVPRWTLGRWPDGSRSTWKEMVARYREPMSLDEIDATQVATAPVGRLREYLTSAFLWTSEDMTMLSLQAKITARWEQIVMTVTEDNAKKEMEVVPTLFLVLLLDRIGSALKRSTDSDSRQIAGAYSRRAVSLLALMALCARRSLHSEVLTRTLLGSLTLRNRNCQLGRRLGDLQTRLSKPLTAEDIEVIRGFCRAVVTRGDVGFDPLAVGLSAAVGDLADLRKLWKNAPACVELINLSRSIPEGARYLDNQVRNRLQQLVAEMLAQNRDIVLLDPILLDSANPVD